MLRLVRWDFAFSVDFIYVLPGQGRIHVIVIAVAFVGSSGNGFGTPIRLAGKLDRRFPFVHDLVGDDFESFLLTQKNGLSRILPAQSQENIGVSPFGPRNFGKNQKYPDKPNPRAAEPPRIITIKQPRLRMGAP